MSSNGSAKSSFLRSLGYSVLVPRLPGWSFRAALRVAQDAFDGFDPIIVVGSSRGGSLALHLDTRDRPMILLAPAYQFFGGMPDRETIPQGSVVIHSPDDHLVPIRHSLELVQHLHDLGLIRAGETHHLNCPGGKEALRRVVHDLVPVPQGNRPSNQGPSTP
jgi:predicted alpha/beta hydrolase family esterase